MVSECADCKFYLQRETTGTRNHFEAKKLRTDLGRNLCTYKSITFLLN